MQNGWFVVIPPILVVVLAFITRRIMLALIIGIFSAAYIAHDFSCRETFSAIIFRIIKILELEKLGSWDTFLGCANIFVCLFLFFLAIIIVLLKKSGAGHAYGAYITQYLADQRQVEMATLIMSFFFFIDGYFSSLTVGSVMQPITDQFKIPRVKLAFLVNALAAPLAVLFPLTSWMAEIVAQLRNSGITSNVTSGTIVASDPFFVYISMIPWMFYSCIILASVWFVVLGRLSFGELAYHEKIAQNTGNLFAGKTPVVGRITERSETKEEKRSLLDFLFPMGMLFLSIVSMTLYFGDYYLFGGLYSLLPALEKSNIFAGLCMGSLICTCVSILYFVMRKKLTAQQIPEIIQEAFKVIAPALILLILIWTLSSFLKDDLKTGQYLAQKLLSYIDIQIFPLMFFLISAFISTMMGSAWGTIGMLVPLGISMVIASMHITPPVMLHDVPMLVPLLGAIISGAVVGNTISPIADVMLMSSTSSGAYHMDLVKAQISFTIPTIISTSFAFFLTGRLLSTYSMYKTACIALGAGLLVNICILLTLHIFNRLSKRS